MTATLIRQIDRIEKLRVRTVERAATQPEEDAAATAIGRIIMKSPNLAVVDRMESQPEPAYSVVGDEDVVQLSGVHLVRETEKAILVYIPRTGRNEWFPLSQVVDADWANGELAVTEWFWRTEKEAAAV